MKNRLLHTQSLDTDMAALLLRLIVGGLFVYYGYTKIASFDSILPLFKDYTGLGAKTSFLLVIFAEFFCGLLVALGFLTRFTIIPILITMVVAYFIAHANDSFEVKQLPLVYLLLSFVIFILGSGRYSVDRLILIK